MQKSHGLVPWIVRLAATRICCLHFTAAPARQTCARCAPRARLKSGRLVKIPQACPVNRESICNSNCAHLAAPLAGRWGANTQQARDSLACAKSYRLLYVILTTEQRGQASSMRGGCATRARTVPAFPRPTYPTQLSVWLPVPIVHCQLHPLVRRHRHLNQPNLRLCSI